MFKAILISINLVALIAVKLFFGGDINIEQKLPETINAGETFTVEVTINKGDREGFAKWQQTLPEGFIATAKSSEGATFSFKNQNVKLIWMALPKAESILITYDVAIDPTIQGDFNFDGKFSFIEENERKDIIAEIKSINVTNGAMADVSQNSPITEEEEENNEEEEAVEENNEEIDNSNDTAINTENETNSSNEEVLAENIDDDQKLVTEDDNIKITRTIQHINNGEYLVSLAIEKGAFNSFGKVEEYLPEGFIASSNENESGIFSFDNKKVKILWMALPTSNTINVSYNMMSESDLLDKATIHGMFSYLKVDESVQLEMKPSKFINYYVASEELAETGEENEDREDNMNESSELENESNPTNKDLASNEMAETTDDASNQNTNAAALANAVNVSEAANSNDSDIQEATKEELIESITDIPSAETDINYKVQIAAGKTEVNQAYFIRAHSINETVSIEYHNNWYKYTLGSYSVYKQARDRRNEIWNADNKINDAFVTAYNSGERITVQEALMISKQQWFK